MTWTQWVYWIEVGLIVFGATMVVGTVLCAVAYIINTLWRKYWGDDGQT